MCNYDLLWYTDAFVMVQELRKLGLRPTIRRRTFRGVPATGEYTKLCVSENLFGLPQWCLVYLYRDVGRPLVYSSEMRDFETKACPKVRLGSGRAHTPSLWRPSQCRMINKQPRALLNIVELSAS